VQPNEEGPQSVRASGGRDPVQCCEPANPQARNLISIAAADGVARIGVPRVYNCVARHLATSLAGHRALVSVNLRTSSPMHGDDSLVGLGSAAKT